MDGFDPKTSFGREESLRYDTVDTRGDERETVAFLARLAAGRDTLELAVGTGRIALPLAQTGVRGDMSRAAAPGRSYGLVYLVYNTIGNLLTQDGQIRCFQNAARHLAPGGAFVLECRVPAAPARPGGQFVDAEQVAAGEVVLDVCRYDPVPQVLDENHVRITAAGIVLAPVSLRLAAAPEFDLMARLAGLRLRERRGGWNGEPYTAASWRHVSVYEPAAGR